MTEYMFAKKNDNGFTSMGMNFYIDDAELQSLYQWLDRLPLSRPKKNIAKDFSDGVLVAEIIKYYFPRLIELHSFTPAIASRQKMDNWFYLNSKVLRKLNLDLSDDVIKALTSCKPNVIEKVLMILREQIDKFIEKSDQIKVKTLQLQNAVQNGKSKTGTSQIQNKDKIMKSPRVLAGKKATNISSRVSNEFKSRPAIASVTDNVPKSLFEEKKGECQAKDETIQILQEKLQKLEHLLHLKDVRIEDLKNKLLYIETKTN